MFGFTWRHTGPIFRICPRSPAAIPSAPPPPRRSPPPPGARRRPARGRRAPAADAPLFGAKQWTLANGLTVALVESRRAPVVAQYLYYAAGGARTRPGGRASRISSNT